MQDKKLDDMTKKYKEEMMRLYNRKSTGTSLQSKEQPRAADTAHRTERRDTRVGTALTEDRKPPISSVPDDSRLSHPPMPEIPKNYGRGAAEKSSESRSVQSAPPTRGTPNTENTRSMQSVRNPHTENSVSETKFPPPSRCMPSMENTRSTQSARNPHTENSMSGNKFPPPEEILRRETEKFHTEKTVPAMAEAAAGTVPAPRFESAPSEGHNQGNYNSDTMPGADMDDMQGEPEINESYPDEETDFSSVDSTESFPEDNPADMSGQGYLQVEVTAASGVVPIRDAAVIITENSGDSEALVGMAVTDENGATPVIPLSAPSQSFSEAPDPSERPYSEYNISVYKRGFYTVPKLTVPIFDTIKSIQPVSLIPLAEFEQEGAGVPNETR